MYITGLEASGLKGLSFAHELRRCVLFTGGNFVGKTARLEAIRLALLGHVPDLGKTNQATGGLAGSSSTLFAKVQFDNGTDANVLFKLDGDSVKQERRWLPSWLEDKRMPMLNPQDYFGLTDSERIQYVFGMMKMPDTFTVDGILADLRNLKLDENTEQTEKARNEIIALVQAAFGGEGVAENLTWGLTELTRDKGLLKNEFTLWNARAKDTQGTLRVLSELKTRSGECSADTIQGVAAELKRVTDAAQQANARAGALSQQQMEANRVVLRRKQIDDELAAAPVTDYAEIERLLRANKAIDTKLKKIKTATDEQMQAAITAHDEADTAVTRAKEERDETVQLRDAEEANLAGLDKETSCPHCHSKGKGWKAALQAGATQRRDAFNAQIATIEAQLKALRKKADVATAAYNKTLAAYDARQALADERRTNQAALTESNAATAGATARRRALQEEASRLRDTEPPTQAELDASAAEAMRLRQEHDALTERHTALVALQQDLIRAGEAAEEHQAAAAKVTVIKAVGALLKERQASMIAVLFGDLMKVANYFTQGIMEHELVFQDGRIGYVKAGRFVAHSTFSGTERALTYIAVTAALMKDSPLRIALIDEFDIDADVFPKVLKRLDQAVEEGLIDQVIVAHTFAPDDAEWACSRRWQHIPLVKAAA